MTEPDDDPQTTLDGFDSDADADRDDRLDDIVANMDELAGTVETLAECVGALQARMTDDGDADTDGQPDATSDDDSLDGEPRGFE